MNIKKLFAFILVIALALASFTACAPKEAVSSGSGVHTESEHNHDHGENDTASKNNSSNKNTSSKINTGLQRPDRFTKEETEAIGKLPELSDQGKTTSKKLFEDIEKINPKAVTFFRVKNTTFASSSYVTFEALNKNLDAFNIIKDKTTIQHLKDALEYSTWNAKKFTSGSTPNIVIYFDDKIHLNIENQIDGVYWMSLNADYGKVYYAVPQNVYENVMAFCYELEK